MDKCVNNWGYICRMEILLSLKKKGNSKRYCNMDGSWKQYSELYSWHNRTCVTKFHLYIVPRVVKPIEKESKIMVSRDERKGVTGVTV